MPIVVSAVFVFIALSIIHGMFGWHKGDMNMGKLFGQWFVYSLFIAVLAAYVTGRTRAVGAPYPEVFRVSGAVTFCCYGVAHWQNWIWWGKSTRFALRTRLTASSLRW